MLSFLKSDDSRYAANSRLQPPHTTVEVIEPWSHRLIIRNDAMTEPFQLSEPPVIRIRWWWVF